MFSGLGIDRSQGFVNPRVTGHQVSGRPGPSSLRLSRACLVSSWVGSVYEGWHSHRVMAGERGTSVVVSRPGRQFARPARVATANVFPVCLRSWKCRA